MSVSESDDAPQEDGAKSESQSAESVADGIRLARHLLRCEAIELDESDIRCALELIGDEPLPPLVACGRAPSPSRHVGESPRWRRIDVADHATRLVGDRIASRSPWRRMMRRESDRARSLYLGSDRFEREFAAGLAKESLVKAEDGTQPGDDYNQRGDVGSILRKHGWKLDRTDPRNEHWTRPGKDGGTSATFNGLCFYVHTSNAPPFDPGEGYSRFAVYAMLEHHGDFSAAASALRKEGFGERKRPWQGEKPFDFQEEMECRHPAQRPPLIHGMARRTETINIIAAPKIGKSWLVADLALCIATGMPWLDRFPVEKGKVLIVDNELHPETIAYRLKTVREAKGITMPEIEGRVAVKSLRGKVRGLDAMLPYFEGLRGYGFDLIVLDAAYRFFGEGTDENSNGDMTRFYNVVDSITEMLGCSVALIHHTSKGIQGGKSVTDTGAGAGAQSRASDLHLVLRPHEEEGVVVLESVARSWTPGLPICLRRVHPLWRVAPELDPSALKRERPGRARTATAPMVPWTVERLVEACVDAERPRKREEVVRAATEAGAGWRQAGQLFSEAVATGRVVAVRLPGQGGPRGYLRPAPDLIPDEKSKAQAPPHTPPVALPGSEANRNAKSEALAPSPSTSTPKQRRKARKAGTP